MRQVLPFVVLGLIACPSEPGPLVERTPEGVSKEVQSTGEKGFTIFLTSSNRGEVEPCG